jgi:ribosomal protein S18 acetylase RimI-like enzyme
MIFLLNNNVRNSSNKINIFSVKNSKEDFFNKKNPFWTHSDYKLFIAWKNSKIVGRIAAIIDYKYCETVGKKIGYFGFFESIDDFECAEAVFNSAQNWLKSKNMTIMRGPIDGRVDINLGFLLTGFDKPASILSSYTPEYYISFAERFNMKKIRDFISYYIDLTKPFPDILKENVQKSIDFGIKIRPFKRFSANLELKWWTQLFLETFKDQWGFVPVSKKEVKSRFGVKQIRWFVDSKLFLVAEYKGSPIAYLWSTPEYNQLFKNFKGRLSLYQLLQILISKKQINIGKLHFIGIKKEFRNKNIASYLNYEALVEMKRRGYIGAEVGFIDERNTVAHSTIAKTGAKRYKKFRVFEKIINT